MRTHLQVVQDLRDLAEDEVSASDIVDAIYGCIKAEPVIPTYEPNREIVLAAIEECLTIWREVKRGGSDV